MTSKASAPDQSRAPLALGSTPDYVWRRLARVVHAHANGDEPLLRAMLGLDEQEVD